MYANKHFKWTRKSIWPPVAVIPMSAVVLGVPMKVKAATVPTIS